MIERTIKACSFEETRPVALFVQTASQFSSSIRLRVGNKNASAKSIMGMIAMEITDGTDITIIAEGKDEELVIPAIERFFHDKAHE